VSTPVKRQSAAGFTLIELLVVIAVIAILAAMLLPALARAKGAGLSAACKSNLHEFGISLSLYTEDYHKYPLWIDGRTLWDATLLPFASNSREVYRCPANKLAPPWTNNTVRPQPNPSYDYNMVGTGRFNVRNPMPLLGLDSHPNYLDENQVKVPSDMIAICDATTKVVGGDIDADDMPLNLLSELTTPRHNHGLNAVFCDGHVEYGKQVAWLRKTDDARQRWNFDHQPHRETWVNNP
jgi:prepilin-type N-terminal cleavage/methylation domain-containing protein/prepilin-type processing-associated H-X9-DG protein